MRLPAAAKAGVPAAHRGAASATDVANEANSTNIAEHLIMVPLLNVDVADEANSTNNTAEHLIMRV